MMGTEPVVDIGGQTREVLFWDSVGRARQGRFPCAYLFAEPPIRPRKKFVKETRLF
jgi:hypothetical protein